MMLYRMEVSYSAAFSPSWNQGGCTDKKIQGVLRLLHLYLGEGEGKVRGRGKSLKEGVQRSRGVTQAHRRAGLGMRWD